MRYYVTLMLIIVLLPSGLLYGDDSKWTSADEANLEKARQDYYELDDKLLDISEDRKGEFVDIDKIKMLIEDFDDKYGFSYNDIQKHVYNRITSSLNKDITFCEKWTEDCVSAPYIYVTLITLKDASVITLSLNRSVLLLPNKSTELYASFWNRSILMNGTTSSRVTDSLDKLLNDLIYSLNKAHQYFKVSKKWEEKIELLRVLNERRNKLRPDKN